MAFIDTTYFRDEIDIRLNSNQVTEFNNFIEKIEKEVLIKLLGYDLYNTFITALAGTPAQKWLDLRDGATYQVTNEDGNLIDVEWIGFQNTEKKSLLAYFVYYHWQRISQTESTMSGEFKTVSENSSSPPNSLYNDKLVNAWNKGAELYGIDLDYYFDPNWFIKGYMRPFHSSFDYYQTIRSGSAFNFLYFKNEDDSTNYPNWYFTKVEKINQFGI